MLDGSGCGVLFEVGLTNSLLQALTSGSDGANPYLPIGNLDNALRFHK
jgi:hypothetical protein